LSWPVQERKEKAKDCVLHPTDTWAKRTDVMPGFARTLDSLEIILSAPDMPKKAREKRQMQTVGWRGESRK